MLQYKREGQRTACRILRLCRIQILNSAHQGLQQASLHTETYCQLLINNLNKNIDDDDVQKCAEALLDFVTGCKILTATSNSTVQGIIYQIIMICSQYYSYDCLIHTSQGAQVHVLKELETPCKTDIR